MSACCGLTHPQQPPIVGAPRKLPFPCLVLLGWAVLGGREGISIESRVWVKQFNTFLHHSYFTILMFHSPQKMANFGMMGPVALWTLVWWDLQFYKNLNMLSSCFGSKEGKTMPNLVDNTNHHSPISKYFHPETGQTVWPMSNLFIFVPCLGPRLSVTCHIRWFSSISWYKTHMLGESFGWWNHHLEWLKYVTLKYSWPLMLVFRI